ncbi:alpha/beta fold hydrolase [Spongiivirga citrea]|uniref:Alpha/beta fold hydrolase n=1 Tax=Spongiivirga citrea TaxID=1481457 RepID=A0A6M0CGI6_9FLAO|nr:alpha/beta hydrolase [Spongiivirga citrea]NER16592.1 alpha/beta fold hydrolase [Spongiivirga citrea]
MKNKYRLLIKSTLVLISILSLVSCSNEGNLNDLNETIFVRHKNADMPAYIKGNASEKVFLITLHGGPGGFGLGFVGTAFSKIEENYGVVYFDQRGSGLSQGSYSNEDISLDLMVEDVLALVKVMKLKFGNDSRFFLLGHSWGGTLGTATLLKDQSDFSGWIEVDGANNPSGLYDQYIETFTSTANTQIALGNSLEFWEWVLTSVAEVDPVSNKDDFFKLNSMSFELEATLQKDNFLNNPDNGSESDGIIFQYNLLTAFWNLSQIQYILVDEQCLFQTLDFTNQLPEITVPSLFISGEYDMVVPAVSAQRAFDNIGSDIKELRIFERSGHSPIASEPERFAEEVLRFMNENK